MRVKLMGSSPVAEALYTHVLEVISTEHPGLGPKQREMAERKLKDLRASKPSADGPGYGSNVEGATYR